MKRSIKSLALAASVLAMAGTAQAATYDINIYGASAQYNFWKNLSATYLTASVANGGQNCTGGTTSAEYNTGSDASNDKKHFIVTGTNCNGGHTINIRISSKASYDGINAVRNTGTAGQRSMLDSVTNPVLVAKDVHVGASDVAGESFQQESHGQKNGPAGGGQYDMAFTGISTSGLTVKNPLVVPFAFFVNNSVTYNKCVGGTNDGMLCVTAGAQDICGTGGTCTNTQLDNISRPMAVNIFGNKSWYWSDLGASFNAGTAGNEIIACHRHAGSGTHATIDYAVLTHGKWGGNLPTQESTAVTSDSGIVYFNESSSNEMNCINTLAGAIGYADADQKLTDYTSTHQVKYQGVPARRNTVRNGLYDFWSVQNLYINNTKTPVNVAPRTIIDSMITWASKPASINLLPSPMPSFWASFNEMVYMKSSDKTYEIYRGAIGTPQVP